MKQSGRYVVILIAAMALWNTVVIKPLKILSVFFHELGHSFMSVIFGNGIAGFRIYFNESGYALTLPKDGFSAVMIANGGYMGSVLFALLILKLKKTPARKYILGACAILLLGMSIAYGDSVFTMICAAIFAGLVIIIYMLRNDKVNDWVIDIIGAVCAVYAVYDTFIDTILLEINRKLGLIPGWGETRPVTDAVQLELMTHVPAVVWGVIWFIIACCAIYSTMLGKRKRPAGARGRRTAA
ncbi:MAG TPA: M50 family metallopeptidase [Clostridiales bacterium]|nr:M50 family metallopeptidase [Clostridiales bacterium]HPP36868.1 M50 family metallopeptidase [Clostridiales bacterium]